ncbi:hypothetical protein [Nevskia ramosa]|uniref:hypothetical protein n=1 Tax=Nevskia ramosa TaxID=64002 RepID=UPI003D0B603B
MTDFDNNGNELATLAVEANAIAVLARAEIDQQIATAHAYPRSLAAFKRRATEMATFDEETAESCIFKRPVGKKKDGSIEYAEGMSIRCAEIVGACFGNLRVGAIIVEQTDRFVKARGRAHDLETNFSSECDVIESTVDRNGKPFSERMRIVVAKATLSKARRDATFAVVPRALCRPVELAARNVALGTAETLASRRAKVMMWLSKLGIDTSRVFEAIGIRGEDEIGLEELAELTGLKTAIKDGEVTVDEAFPPLGEGAGIKKPTVKAPASTVTPKTETATVAETTVKADPPQGDQPNFDKTTGEIFPTQDDAPKSGGDLFADGQAEVDKTVQSKPAPPQATPGVIGMIRRKMAEHGFDDGAMQQQFGVTSVDTMTAPQGQAALEYFAKNKKATQ